MHTKNFIDLLEYLTDNWPESTIDVDDLAETIHAALSERFLISFIQDYGGCCLACAIDRYFEQSEHYHLVTDCDRVCRERMVENL